MLKPLLVSQGEFNLPQFARLKNDLSEQGFQVWVRDSLGRGSGQWWRSFSDAMQDTLALIVMMTPATKKSIHAQAEIALAHKQRLPIIPLLFEGDAASSIPDTLLSSDWLDVTDFKKYRTKFEVVLERLYTIIKTDPKIAHPQVMAELQQIPLHIPQLKWLQIVSIDGWSHPAYRLDAGSSLYSARGTEEDRVGAMSGASLSLGERIASELGLGEPQFMVISGQKDTHFLIPIGTEWVISFVINGHPATDDIIQYFRERNFLAAILPFLKVIF